MQDGRVKRDRSRNHGEQQGGESHQDPGNSTAQARLFEFSFQALSRQLTRQVAICA